MSEYQYVHFAAVDRPLDDKQLKFMEEQSTRADISRWEFTNEYHFGSFHGNAAEMLRRGYDVHLHFANYGIRKLMFRLPELPCDKKTFAAFEVDCGITWTKDKRGKAGVLSIQPEADAGSYDYLDDVQSMPSRLAPLREMLMHGDLRPLYLAWLACAYDEGSIEPSVPAGLANLDDALETMAEFYELSPDLISAAAEQSPVANPKRDRQATAAQWVARLSKVELKQIVNNLVIGDAATVKADALGRLSQSLPAPSPQTALSTRSLAQLRQLAASMQNKRAQREALAQERARKKYLKSIAADPKKTIRRIDALVAERKTRSYHQAAECLTDLAKALGPEQGPPEAKLVAQRLRQKKPRSNALIKVLREQGWFD